MKIKFESIQDQAQLDALLEEYKATIQAQTKANYEEASQRTAAKYEALQSEVKNYKSTIKELQDQNLELSNNFEESRNALDEAYRANDTYALSEALTDANVNPKFHELLINSTGIHSDMEPEELGSIITSFAEEYPEMMVQPKQPSVTPPSPEGTNEEPQDFDTNKTWM